MNVVDSSAWLEYFADGRNAEHFADAIEGTSALVSRGSTESVTGPREKVEA